MRDKVYPENGMLVDEVCEEYAKTVYHIEQGDIEAYPTYVELYEIEKVAKELREQITKYVMDEIQHAGKDDLSYNGYNFKKVSTTMYSYKDEEVDRLKALLKGRQDMMKRSAELGGLTDQYGEDVPMAEKKYRTYIKLEKKR
jgi:hypothetical protein